METGDRSRRPTSLALPNAQLRGLQTLALILVWWLAQSLTSALHLPIPGSLVGLLFLWGLLDRGWVRPNWIEQGANSLLKHLMLFFVPAMLALVDRPELLSLLGLKLLVTVLVSTVVVMCGTAFIVEIGFRMRHARAR